MSYAARADCTWNTSLGHGCRAQAKERGSTCSSRDSPPDIVFQECARRGSQDATLEGCDVYLVGAGEDPCCSGERPAWKRPRFCCIALHCRRWACRAARPARGRGIRCSLICHSPGLSGCCMRLLLRRCTLGLHAVTAPVLALRGAADCPAATLWQSVPSQAWRHGGVRAFLRVVHSGCAILRRLACLWAGAGRGGHQNRLWQGRRSRCRLRCRRLFRLHKGQLRGGCCSSGQRNTPACTRRAQRGVPAPGRNGLSYFGRGIWQDMPPCPLQSPQPWRT